MNTWKVTLQHDGKTIEIQINAFTYSDAYMKAEQEYPGCRIVHIKKLINENNKRF
jgi:hypothetical protein